MSHNLSFYQNRFAIATNNLMSLSEKERWLRGLIEAGEGETDREIKQIIELARVHHDIVLSGLARAPRVRYEASESKKLSDQIKQERL